MQWNQLNGDVVTIIIIFMIREPKGNGKIDGQICGEGTFECSKG